MERRTIEYKVRLSPSEAKTLDARVKKCKVSREAFLRHVIAGSIPREDPPIDYYHMMEEIYNTRSLLEFMLEDSRAKGFSAKELELINNKIDTLILDITKAVIEPKQAK